MTDQTIPADKVRAILANRDLRAAEMIAEIESILPPPPRPTMADMTEEERAACQWMQADAGDSQNPVVICRPENGALVLVMTKPGTVARLAAQDVTPRPDLPRLEWPGDTTVPAPALALPDGWRLADHKKYGRVIVTRPTPDSDGNVYFVAPADSLIGNDWHFCTPEALTYLDQEAEDVPPVKVGDEIESADDPRIAALPVGSVLRDLDGDEAEKTTTGEWDAEGITIESPECGPWRVVYIPKETDQ